MKAFYLESVDVAALMRALDSCKGEVKLMTDEGDYFNLKSKLSQIAGIMNLLECGKQCNAQIYCSNPKDEKMLLNQNLFTDPEVIETK